MKQYHYAGDVVIPPLQNRDDPIGSNLELQRQIHGRDDLLFFPWVHVGAAADSEASMLEYLERNLDAIDGVKFHASISQIGIADKRLRAVLGFLDRHGLPLLYHCGRHPISSAAPVKEIADSYPGVKFILAHLGGNAYDLVVDTMKMLNPGAPENVFLDTSTARHPALLRKAIETYGEGKIIFGTDLPFTEMNMNWACLEFARLTNNVKILGGNLRRILRKPS